MYFRKTLSSGEQWSIVYDKAIRPDGTLFFPSRLNREFLETQRKTMGSYIFFNQYLNEIIPEGEQDFKAEWLKYYDALPRRFTTFAFIDPAISLAESADFTALVVVRVSEDNDWYVEVAKRAKLTATQTLSLIFKVHELYKPNMIGIETVAYQQALIHFLDAEMRRRNVVVPVHPVTRGSDQTKEMRIRGLVPRFEWGRVFVKRGLVDFEEEYAKFPRSPHDDLLDALSSIEEIAYPIAKERKIEREPAPNSPEYERWFIQNLQKRQT